jgi:FMN phosphatase YigB (HAD superfamily)
MPPVRFIYFDLDDTLLDHGSAEEAALRDLYSRHSSLLGGRSFDDVHDHYRRINSKIWQSYSSGEIDKGQARRLRFIRLAEAIDLVDPDIVESLPDAYLDRYACHWTPVDGAFAAFEYLAERVPVGILTNGFAEIQHAKLERFPSLRRTASRVVISEEVGHMKPDPRIFTHAAREANVDAAEILYIGDSLRSDVRGGRGAGWNVAWFGGDDETQADAFCFTEWHRLIEHAERLIRETPG